jgi:hypothetical protein
MKKERMREIFLIWQQFMDESLWEYLPEEEYQ